MGRSSRQVFWLLLAWRWGLFVMLASGLGGRAAGGGTGPWLTLLVCLAAATALATGLLLLLTGVVRGLLVGLLDLGVAVAAAWWVRDPVVWLLFTLGPLDLVEVDAHVALTALLPGLVLYSTLEPHPANLQNPQNVLHLGLLLLVGVLVWVLHLGYRQERLAQALVSFVDACGTDGRPSMEKLLEAVLGQLQILAEARTVACFLGTGQGTVRLAASVGAEADAFKTYEVEELPSLVTDALRGRQTVTVADYRTHPTARMPEPAPGLRSVIVAPLTFDGQPLGAVWVSTASVLRPLGAAEASLIERLAAQVALALRGIQLQEASERAFAVDPLTGLYRGTAFRTLLAHHLVKAKYAKHPLSVLVVDIDGFKRLNAEYGHPQADSVLKQVATAIHGLVRNRDLVTREEADLFCLALLQTPQVGALVVAERIRALIEETEFVAGEAIVRLTASIGLASKAEGDRTANELLEAAQTARAQAKAQGGNKACFTP